MKSLALYIDKWYIVGAVCTDGYTRLVKLPNQEDRIWLYFYEDVANDEISYSKGFQSKFRNNENHYYGNVFSLITQSTAKYVMFKRPQPMVGIFKSAKIFDDLRKDMDEEDDITTYVSFSQDITAASRLLFLRELKEERFDVKVSVARIDLLALEYAAKKTIFCEEGYYLVLNACNENLHYSLYKKSASLFNRVGEDVLYGMGTDVRSRALIEFVVDNINARERFLKTKDEREAEYLRMNQYVDDWIVKLNTARNFIPFQITNVTFSNDPYKDYSVSVRKAKIDERTDKIVKDIINVIVNFVKDADVSHDQIKGILFLGNTFTNNQFRKELSNHYNLDNNKMINYKDDDLSSLVSSYTFIDCEQFSATTKKFQGDAKDELLRIRNAEEEESILKRAQEEAEAKAVTEHEASEAERKYKDAMERGYDAEREHNFDDMEEYFNIALSYRPDNEEAKQKHEEALRRKAEMVVQQNHYKEKIQQAKSAYDEADYELAKFKAEEALSYKPESEEAQRIKEDANRRIKSQKELERYLDRADLFIAKKAYNEAKQELEKARLLDVDDKVVVERIAKIAKEQNAVKAQIQELTDHLDTALNNGLYDDALKCCNELIDVDFANSRKWSVRIADINNKKEKAAEEKKRWDKFLRDIDAALLNEEWKELADLCKAALEIRDNEDIRSKLNKAENKLSEMQKQEQFQKTMSEINELAVRKEFDKANTKLNSLERTLKEDGLLDSIKEKIIRDTRKSLFDFGQSDSDRISQRQNKLGGRAQTTDVSNSGQNKTVSKPTTKRIVEADFDWDFETSPQSNKTPKHSPTTKPQKTTSNDNSFFSTEAAPSQSKKNATKSDDVITNDDFNF